MPRLFVAVRPPPEVLAQLEALPRPPEPGVRWVPPAQWHVTLRFLGEAPEEAIVAAVRAAAGEFAGPVVGRVVGRVAGPVVGRVAGPVVGPAAGTVAGEGSGSAVGADDRDTAGPAEPAIGSAVAPPVAVLGPRVSRLGRDVVCVPVAGLDALAGVVVAATAALGQPPDPRPFAGHLTLARLRQRAACGVTGTACSARFPVTGLEVVRSTLSPSGAHHEVVATVALGG